MREKSKLREELAEFINENPRPEGYVPSFFVKKFTVEVQYCRHLLLDLAEKGKILKRNYKGKNNKKCYRFFSTGQKLGAVGMNNFVSPSIFSNNNIELPIDTIISRSPSQWNKFVKGVYVHYLMTDSSKRVARNLLRKVIK
jgi:hypothetical protein